MTGVGLGIASTEDATSSRESQSGEVSRLNSQVQTLIVFFGALCSSQRVGKNAEHSAIVPYGPAGDSCV
jgi:hypothetical protein